MKKKYTCFWLIAWILVCTLCLNACSQKDRDDTKIYSDEEIYLKSWECGYLGQFPHFPVIIETEEQLAYAEQYYDLYEISDVFREMISQYPIEQYTYMISYHETSPGAYYHADRVEIGDDFISFGMDKKSHGPKDRAVPAVIVGFIHTAAIPKEYMKECDFSGMMVVIPGEVSQTVQPETESVEETAESEPEVFELDAYETVLADWMPKDPQAKEAAGFALLYLDEDDIPELAVIAGWAHLSGVNIYTYEQGKAVFVGKYGQYGAMGYMQKEGIVFDDYDQGGNLYSRVYQIDKSNSTLLSSYDVYNQFAELEESEAIYEVDGQEVSREQYQEESERWNADGMRVINYGMCVPVTEADIRQNLEGQLETLISTQKEVLQQRVLAESGFTEDAILMMDYDDYDRDGKCEAFMFCGEVLANRFYEEKGYNGELWFVGEKQCTLLREGTYRMIDGSMTLGPNQKYLYLYSNRVFTANISELWTVIDGEPVEDELSDLGQIVYRGGDSFEIWIDGYDHFYEPKHDMWRGHTYRPYFYEYKWSTGRLERYEEKTLSDEELAELCGFDLAAQVRAEGYEITKIVQWGGRIVTVNYTIPLDENDLIPEIVYENIIWDCSAKDYWRSEELGVTSWRDAGVGGSF